MIGSASQENKRTLEGLLGISEDQALAILSVKVAITASEANQDLAQDLSQLLAATLTVVPASAHPDLEVCLGKPPVSNATTILAMGVTKAGITISNFDGELPKTELPHGLLCRIGCCFAAGCIIGQVSPDSKLGLGLPFEMAFANIISDQEALKHPIQLNGAVLVGGGGVANGFLWGLQTLDARGDLPVVDPKVVSPGNLNRCFFFDRSDLNSPKAEVISAKASNERMRLIPQVMTFKDYVATSGHPPRLAIVTVDSRMARREIQAELPSEVLDASTTDISDVVVHSHVQPSDGACLGCIYIHVREEDQHERHVAEALGVDVEDVRKDFITAAVAAKLRESNPDLIDVPLEGTSLQSLFKARCADQVLLTAAAKQTLAPLGFISNLAGLLLVLELALRASGALAAKDSEYVRMDPWRPPHPKVRSKRGKNPDCQYCGRPEFAIAMSEVWPENFR